MRYSPKKDDDKWIQYDNTRIENQFKTIKDLQSELSEYQKRERAFVLHSKIKEQQISNLKKEIKDLINKQSEKMLKHKNEINVDYLLQSEFKILQNLLKEKEDNLLLKDEELMACQTIQNNGQFKKLVAKCRDLNKENSELYNYTQGGTLENLKYENGLEKSQIDQLMIKLKEKEIINGDMEYEVNEISDNISTLNKRIKEIEERNSELEKELKK